MLIICVINNNTCYYLGYVGIDCSVATDAVPIILRFRRGCTCDVRKRRCSRVFVTADNIYESDQLTCMIQSADSVSQSISDITLLHCVPKHEPGLA